MSEKVELATAWIRLVPSTEGVTDSVVKALAPGQKASEEAGSKAGKGWAGGLKSALGPAAIGAGVIAGFVGLYKVGEIFDDVTDTIRIGTGLQGEALDELVGIAKNVGREVPAEFSAIGGVVADVNTRMGLSGDTLQTVASQYLEAGRILGSEVDINKTSAAFSAFKIEGEGVIGAMDTLFQVSQATGVGMNELATGAQNVAPAMQILGFSFEDTVAMVGSLDKAGLNSTAVMAAMSKGMVTLAKDGEEPAEAFSRVTGELQGFVDTGDTASALDLAGKVFGTRGAAQFVGALQSGVLNMDDLMAATGATGDTILGVGEETMDFAERFQMTMNTALVAIEPLATAVFNAVGDALAFVMPFLLELGNWAGENSEVLGIAAAVIGGVLVAAFVSWTAAIIANSLAWLASPITWIILGIVVAVGLLVAAGIWLVQNWDGIVAWLGDLWSGFVSWLTGVIDGFVAWWNEMWLGFGNWIQEIWLGFTTWITDVWLGFTGWLMGALAGLASWWTGFWAGIGQVVSDIWQNWIVGPIRAAIDWLTGAIQAGLKFIDDAWRNTWDGLGSIVRNVWNGILGWLENGINGAIGLINDMIRGVNVVGGAFGLEIALIPRVNIPRLAEGATILPRPGGTAAILAEAGKPETVVDTGLMNRALREGLAGGEGEGRGIQPGDRVVFEIEGTPLTAVAKRVIRSEIPTPGAVMSQFAR